MLATIGQVRRFREIFADAGIGLDAARLRKFKNLTKENASKAITTAEEDSALWAVAAYRAPRGMATAPQLAYFMKIRRALNNPATEADIEHCKGLTWTEMQTVNRETVQAYGDHQDALGITPSAWRLERGWFDPEALREGQRAATARQAARRADIEARVAQRQHQKPQKRHAVAYPGESGHL